MSATFDTGNQKKNLAGTVPPGVSDDTSAGYEVGSSWVDIVANLAYTCVDATNGAAVWNQTGSTLPTASEVTITTGVGTPTVDTVQERIDSTGSSGYFSGGAITIGTGNTADVAAGEGFIRDTASSIAVLKSFKWVAVAGLVLTDNAANYIFVDSTGTVSASTNEFAEAENSIILGVCIKENAAVISCFNFGVRLEEGIAQAGRFLRRTLSISRDVRRGGLFLGETGTRNITLSTGHLWWGRTDYTIASIDTSVSGSFDAFYQDGVGGVTTISAQTTWDNLQYDDGSGTLATLVNNKWAVQWFFIEPDGHLSMVYGTTSSSSSASAELETVPTVLPARVSAASILLGRLIFQKSAGTATFESAFNTTFAPGVANFTDPMTTIGDVIVRDATNATARLAVGTAGQVLKSDGTNVAWGTAAGSGDMLVATYDVAGVAEQLVGLVATQTLTNKTFGDAVSGVTPTASTHLATKGYVDGMKNLLINALGTINQRAYVSGTATTSANEYTLDRWRVVTSGQNLAFSNTANVVTMTAPAGGIEQVIEGLNIQSGTHVISWTGTATCTVDGVAKVSGDTFTLVGGTDATVKFIGGTVSKPQVESGSVATTFENRDSASELAKCKRYFEARGSFLLTVGNNTSSVIFFGQFIVPKRTANSGITFSSGTKSIFFPGIGTLSSTATLVELLEVKKTGFKVKMSGFSGITGAKVGLVTFGTADFLEIEDEL